MTESTQVAEEKKAKEGDALSLEAIATVDGAPFLHMPEDLYIPPDALEVFLESFEGPLDLLLYLIRKDNLDILNIPIAAVTKQYMEYIEIMSELRMELAAEYLLMAAMLTEIKSKMLLPRPEAASEDEEDDPRAELVRRLQEYERFKKAALEIDLLDRLERDVFVSASKGTHLAPPKPLPELKMDELLKAMHAVLQRQEQLTHHRIKMEPLSVRERMTFVLDHLQGKGEAGFSELLKGSEGRAGAVVSLLAILELNRESLLEIIQDEPLAPIHVRLRSGVMQA